MVGGNELHIPVYQAYSCLQVSFEDLRAGQVLQMAQLCPAAKCLEELALLGFGFGPL